MTDLSNREKTLFDLAKQYRASQVRSANENDIRADIRENVEKLGLDSKAFQDSIRMELELTPGERTDYVNGLQDMQAVLNGRADDLFGEEEMRKKAERIKRREEKAAGKPAPRTEADAKSDKNPRSDPAAGGAGKKGRGGRKAAEGADTQPAGDSGQQREPTQPDGSPWPDDTQAAANAAREQQEGAAVLNQVGDKSVDNVTPISQSQKAADKLAAAKLN